MCRIEPAVRDNSSRESLSSLLELCGISSSLGSDSCVPLREVSTLHFEEMRRQGRIIGSGVPTGRTFPCSLHRIRSHVVEASSSA